MTFLALHSVQTLLSKERDLIKRLPSFAAASDSKEESAFLDSVVDGTDQGAALVAKLEELFPANIWVQKTAQVLFQVFRVC